MAQFEVTPVVHGEVIQKMNKNEIIMLMNELTFLMQNQDTIVTLSSETKGLRHIWDVLTGKQRKSDNKIKVKQTEINKIVSEILKCLMHRQLDIQEDIQYLKTMVMLQSIYLVRISLDLNEAGISDIDIIPLETTTNEPLPGKPNNCLPGTAGYNLSKNPTSPEELPDNSSLPKEPTGTSVTPVSRTLPKKTIERRAVPLPKRSSQNFVHRPGKLSAAQIARIKSNTAAFCTYRGWIFYIDVDNAHSIQIWKDQEKKETKNLKVSEVYAVRVNGEDHTLISGSLEVLVDGHINIGIDYEMIGETIVKDKEKEFKMPIRSSHPEYQIVFYAANKGKYAVRMRDFLIFTKEWDEVRDGWDYDKEKRKRKLTPSDRRY